MTELDIQRDYWERVAEEKRFTHPLRMECLRRWVPADGRLLDVGCGYGRSLAALKAGGFRNVIGVDTSAAMIARGRREHPDVDLRHLSDDILPFDDGSADACLLLAVLTCVPTDAGQRKLVGEIRRVLKSGGILYLSDYPLQTDARNRERYDRFASEFGTFGVFRLSDGGVMRHHSMAWIHALLAGFAASHEETRDVMTMHGNAATIFQIIARKKG